MAQFQCASYRPISANTGGQLSPNLGLVLHHQVGNGSLYDFFNNPAKEVSAHFWVSKSGAIEQYVDTGTVAWHGMSLNSRYCGVETEGCSPVDEKFTDQQIDALARLYAEGMRVHGWANALANKDGEKGFGFHRMAVSTACPCDLRLTMRPVILEKASGTTIPPTPEPHPPTPGPGPSPAPPWPGRLFTYPPVTSGVNGDVRTWQQRMRDRGWSLGVDNLYGQESKDVCTQFQREKSLMVDGIVGRETWNAAWELPVT